MPRISLPNDFHWEIYRALNPDLNFKYPWMYSSYFLRNGYRRIYHINQVYPEFNCEIYRKNYCDLQNLDNLQLQLHWINYGKNENRNCSYLIKTEPTEPTEPTESIVNLNNDITFNELWKTINMIFYINLNHRVDRRNEIRNEFEWAKIPVEKILRIEAIENKKKGALGCSASHIKSIETAINMGLKNVLILEDDFNFYRNSNYLIECLNFLLDFNEEWDVILFSGNVFEKKTYNKYLDRISNSQTASGYLVNSNYFHKLLNNFREGYILFRQFPKKSYYYAVDMFWKNLQSIDKWFIFNPKLGYQRPSFSNNEKKFVNYNL